MAVRTEALSSNRLTGAERRLLAVLAVPTFGLALSITIVVTYMPVLLADLTDSGVVIGLVVGGEGLFALLLPLLVGAWSDRVAERSGTRLPFLLAATPVAGAALVLIPATSSIVAMAALALTFYVAYFVYYPPYRALYPDLVPARLHGRAQSFQGVARGAGLATALAGGGALLAVWRPLPFLVAAAALATATAILAFSITEEERPARCCLEDGLSGTLQRAGRLLRERGELRSFVVANSLWELGLAALKSFVVVFMVVGLGHSVGFASAIIGVVAVASLGAAVVAGTLADRYGVERVVRIALWVYGVGLLVPLVTQSPALVVPVLPVIAFGGAVVMTLPYALLMRMMPVDSRGTLSGVYELSRGVGLVLGPLAAGIAIDVLRPLLPGTDGYAALWLVAGGAILLSIPAVRALCARAADARGGRPAARGRPVNRSPHEGVTA